jgi:hypothetical protein
MLYFGKRNFTQGHLPRASSVPWPGSPTNGCLIENLLVFFKVTLDCRREVLDSFLDWIFVTVFADIIMLLCDQIHTAEMETLPAFNAIEQFVEMPLLFQSTTL